MKNKAEAVIIGGGISGCAVAYELAKKGMTDVVLLERRFLASGATGRCGAGVRMQWGTETNCKLAKLAIEKYSSLSAELDYERDIEFKQGGYLIVAATEREMNQFRTNVELQHSLGIPSRIVSPDEALEIIPYLNRDAILGGSFCHLDGHLNPFYATYAYANAAERLGVEIACNTTVEAIDTENGRICGVKTNAGYISTPRVVNCSGGNSGLISNMVGVELPTISERHEILVTEPLRQMQGPMLMGFVYNIYCQQTPHGSFIMGRGDENAPRDGRITSDWRFMEEMAKSCCYLLPPLKNLNIVRQWAGLYNLTPDRQPIYGAVDQVEGYYLAVGFSGHGLMFGPVTGLLLSECITGQPYTIDVSCLSYDRFSKGELVIEPSVV